MKVIGYEVKRINGAIPFQDAIESIDAGTRHAHLRHYGMRIDRCERPSDQTWIALDLTKVLRQDVNIADDQGHTRPIRRSGEEDFSTNTAAVYYPNKNKLLLQWNNQGVSGNLFRQYMSDHCAAESGQYEFARLATPGDSADVIRSKRVNKIKIGANLKFLENHGLMDGSILYELFGNARERANGDWLSLTITCKREKKVADNQWIPNSLDPQLVEELVGYTETVMSINQRALRVNYYDLFERDISNSLLSLLRKSWSYERDLEPRDSETQRYPFEDRRDLILHAATEAP